MAQFRLHRRHGQIGFDMNSCEQSYLSLREAKLLKQELEYFIDDIETSSYRNSQSRVRVIANEEAFDE